MKHLLSDKKGLTLIEMIIVLFLSVAAISIIFMVYNTGMRSFKEEMSHSDIFIEGGKALDSLTREIKEARKITSPESESISLWYKDLNLNQSIDQEEIIRYSKQGQNLVKTTSLESKILAGRITNLNFYYDSAVNPRLVTIKLTVVSADVYGTFESKVKLRNF